MITLKCEDLTPQIFNYDVVLFPMGINNVMDNGVAYEIGLNCPPVKKSEMKQRYGDKSKLGTIHATKYNNTIFCACYIHQGGYHKNKNGSFVDYEALRQCLEKVNKLYKGKKIASPFLGLNEYEGNGDKSNVFSYFTFCCKDIDITLYDYEEIGPKKYFQRIATIYRQQKESKITKDEYTKLRSQIEWERRHGIFIDMPEDYVYQRTSQNNIEFRGNIKK